MFEADPLGRAMIVKKVKLPLSVCKTLNRGVFVRPYIGCPGARKLELISLHCTGSIGGLTVCFHARLTSCLSCHLSNFSVTPARTHTRAQPALPQTGDRWTWNQRPRLFWNLESEATARCKNSAVTEAKQKQRLVSVMAKVSASLLTVTLTSVLRCTKQIRLSAPLIRLILSQRQDGVYVPLL